MKFIAQIILGIFVFSFLLPMAGTAQTPTGRDMSESELKFLLVDRAGLFPCADDTAKELASERKLAVAEFAAIRKDRDTFQPVVKHLGFRGTTSFTADERLLIHCFYRKVKALKLEPEGEKFKVVMEGAGSGAAGTQTTLYIDRKGQTTEVQSSSAAPSVSPPLTEMGAPAEEAGPEKSTKMAGTATRFRLLDHYKNVVVCSPIRPVRRGAGYDALERNDPEAMKIIRQRMGMATGRALSAEEKQKAYVMYQKLLTMRVEKLVEGSYFLITVREKTGAAEVEGIIDAAGKVKVLKKSAVADVCPK